MEEDENYDEGDIENIDYVMEDDDLKDELENLFLNAKKFR